MKDVLLYIEHLRGQGKRVAIELPHEGYWVQPDDVLSVDSYGWLVWRGADHDLRIPPNTPLYLKVGEPST